MALARACQACGSQKSRVVHGSRISGVRPDDVRISAKDYGAHLPIDECCDCGLWFVRPENIPGNLLEAYKKFSDDEYEEEIRNRGVAFGRILDRVEKILPQKGRLLDVGCATGYLARMARDRGWQAEGTEPSAWAAAVARKKHGIDVAECGIMDMKEDGPPFDAVMLLDVIEHVEDPGAVLAKIRSLLKKGGVLCLVTPNRKALIARIFGKRWWHIRLAHLYYFDRATIGKLLERQGFAVHSTRRYAWHFSLQYVLERLGQLPVLRRLDGAFAWLARRPLSKRIVIPLLLGDSLEIYATSR